MDSKRVGISFLLLVLLQILAGLGIGLYYLAAPDAEELSITTNLIAAQIMNTAPVLLVILFGRREYRRENVFADVLGFRPIKISTAFMAVLFTILIIPLSTLANAVSMIFVDNAVEEIAGDVLDVPFAVMFFLMAVFAPFFEELVFRGAFFLGFRRSGNIFGAVMLSAVLFALMHMNFNQAAYAFVIGVMMALAAEATGSTVTSFIVHLIFNAQSVCLMYLSEYFAPGLWEEEVEMAYSGQEMLKLISDFLYVVAGSTALAFCVLAWMASNERRYHFFRVVWDSRKAGRERLFNVWLAAGIVLALAYMIFEAVMAAF